MGTKKTKTEQGSKNKEILRTAPKKYALADGIRNAGRDVSLETAQRNRSALYKGRLAGTAAQQTGDALEAASRFAAGNGNKRLKSGLKIGNAVNSAFSAASSAGMKRGTLAKDTAIANILNLDITGQQSSSSAMTALSQVEDKRLQASAAIAASEANNLRGAAVGLAGLGIGKAMEGSNDALDQANRDAFALHEKANPGASFSDWAQATKGAENGYQAEHKEWYKNLANRATGGG